LLILRKYSAIARAFPCTLVIFNFTVRACSVCCATPSISDGRVVIASRCLSAVPILV
jgi:hypothetical protein